MGRPTCIPKAACIGQASAQAGPKRPRVYKKEAGGINAISPAFFRGSGRLFHLRLSAFHPMHYNALKEDVQSFTSNWNPFPWMLTISILSSILRYFLNFVTKTSILRAVK